ncbi:MAG: hypothetical protein IPO63_07720 [Bacteroidetes bacterium]|nr:hypothetical protein [Bacteroidota bacterium]
MAVQRCDGVYADIEDEATTEPEIVIDQYGTQPTQIRDAKNAIVIRHDSPFKIQHCTFFNNYKDIVFEKYKKRITNGLQQNDENTIAGNTFTSNGGTLLNPYSTQHKEVAIELNDVENIRIGKVGGTANLFDQSKLGINLINSGAEIWNNEFDVIFTPPSSPS